MKKPLFPHLQSLLANALLLLAATLLSIQLWSKEEKTHWQSGLGGMRAMEPGSFGSVGLYFEENLGQHENEVQFLARGEGYQVLLEARQARIQLLGGAEVQMRLASGNREATMEGRQLLPGPVHYLLGNDPSRWIRNVARYGEVSVEQIYPGIDLVFHSRNQMLEYDFLVEPGADPSLIEMEFKGSEKIGLDDRGNLNLWAGGEEMQLMAPYVYQEIEGRTRVLAVNFEIRESGKVGFKVEAYDPDHVLVIDPILVYSSQLGGDRTDVGRSVVVDAAGNAYIAGETGSSDFPAPGLLGESEGFFNSFIAKFSPQGELLFSTILGGSRSDGIQAVTLDPDGNLIVTGTTFSADFPIKDAFQAELSGFSDVFLTKISADGTDVLYSTYFGGANWEDLETSVYGDFYGGLAVDAAGNAYIGGATRSTDFHTMNAFQPEKTVPDSQDYDAFVAKFDASGQLVYSSYLGGTGIDLLRDLALDEVGALYAVGGTESADFPFVNANRTALEGQFERTFRRRLSPEAFLVKVSPDGSTLEYASFIGGNGDDDGAGGLFVEAPDRVYVLGHTNSTDFPIDLGLAPAKDQEASKIIYRSDLAGGTDLFITRINTADSEVELSALIGGRGQEVSGRLTMDGSGNLVLTGSSSSFNYPLWMPVQGSRTGGADVIVSSFDPTSGEMNFSSYLGSQATDWGQAVAVAGGSIFLTGLSGVGSGSRWRPFPLARPGGTSGPVFSSDAFITKLDPSLNQLLTSGEAWMGRVLADTNRNGFPDPRDETISLSYDEVGHEIHFSSSRWGTQRVALGDLGPDSRYREIRIEKEGGWVATARVSASSGGRVVAVDVEKIDPDDPDPLRQGTVELIDDDGDGVVDAISVQESGQPRGTISLQRIDVDNDGRADFVTIPWSLNQWFKVRRADSIPDPQVFLPLGDTNDDGFPDTPAPDFNGDGIADAELPLIAAFSGPGIPSQYELYFAHFGDGQDVLFSEILLYSLGEKSAQVHIDLRDDAGNPLTVDLNGEIVNGATALQIPVCSLRSLRTDGKGPLVSGSVTVTSDQPLGGVILFGGVIGLAGVGSSGPMTDGFFAPIEANQVEQTSTGVAIKNLEKDPVTLTFSLLSASGEGMAETSFDIAGLGHTARFADELFPALDLTQFLGVLLVRSSGRITATVLQIRPGELATLPVVNTMGGGGETLFAHFGEGAGLLFSQFLVLNLNPEALVVNIRVRDQEGGSQSVDLNGTVLDNGAGDFDLSPLGILSARTDGEGDLIAGSALLRPDPRRRIAGVILFGGSVGVAGVPSSELMPRGFMAPIQADLATGLNTGVAITNGAPFIDQLALRLLLLDRDGKLLATATPAELPARGHMALFIDQFEWVPEPGITLDFNGFSGLLKVRSSGPVAAVVLQTRPGQFATMPVSPYSR